MKLVYTVLFVLGSFGMIATGVDAYGVMWANHKWSFIIISSSLFLVWLTWIDDLFK